MRGSTVKPHGLRSLHASLVALSLLGSPQEPTEEEGIRLVVLVVVDQLPPDQLERLDPFLEGGLGRFLREGRVFTDAAHMHAATETGPGHATLATGVHPSRHGIVGNEWLATEPGGRPKVYCVEDESSLTVRSPGAGRGGAGEAPERAGPGRSPRNLLVPGLSDYLREAHPGSRTVSVGMKDRSAICAGGRRPDLALWWDRRSGAGFVSSSWYGEELPEWVAVWNGSWPSRVGAAIGSEWAPSWGEGEPPPGTAADDREGERKFWGSRTMPHQVPGPPEAGSSATDGELASLAEWVYHSPVADAFVVDLARRAVVERELGGDDAVDFLFVGLAACDTVGHIFGPRSHEVTDVILRADRELAVLFELLDREVGPERWVAALSSDHGVLQLPEELAARGIDAGRRSGRPLAEAIAELRVAWTETFGRDFDMRTSSRGLRLVDPALAAPGAHGITAEEVRRWTAAFLGERVPDCLLAVAIDELAPDDAEGETGGETGEKAAEDPGRDMLVRLLRNSTHPARSPDVAFVWKPNTVAVGLGTTHGSPHAYDRSVPLVFLGPGLEPGTSAEPCATVDLCPTLLSLAGVPAPDGVDGRVLIPGAAAEEPGG